MSKAQDRGPLDWLVEVAGASAPAVAAAFAAFKLAPTNGWPVAPAVLIGGAATFAAAWAVMRLIPAEAHHLALPDFGGVVLEDELLLDQPWAAEDDILWLDQPLMEQGSAAVAELLLDDPLPVAEPGSRVVQLFADGRMPSAGQLLTRIDRHLSDNGNRAPSSDASDALSEALAELRRSLRQA